MNLKFFAKSKNKINLHKREENEWNCSTMERKLPKDHSLMGGQNFAIRIDKIRRQAVACVADELNFVCYAVYQAEADKKLMWVVLRPAISLVVDVKLQKQKNW